MTAELRNLPHIASMAFNEPLMLEPAYARVFFCALAGQLGISRLTDAVSGDSLAAGEAPATLALSGDDDGPRQARSYQVMNGIAVLPVSGTLVSRTRALQPYSGMTGYNGIIARLQQAASDPMVDGILLDMDTPGGMVAGAFDCADIIARVRDIKPVWALANDMNCSAGQLLASAASRRLVTQTARTGSIGVMMAHSNYGAALEKQGVEITLIYSGSHKVDGNPYSHLPDDVRETLQSRMDATRQMFAQKVSAYTGLSVQAVLDTEAAVYSGQEAIDAGLADELVNSTDAITVMRDALDARKSRLSGGRMTKETQSTTVSATASQADVTGVVQATEGENASAAQPDVNAQITAAVAAENSRIMGILNCEEAHGREEQARVLAETPGMTVETARRILAAAPQSAQTRSDTALDRLMQGAPAPLAAGTRPTLTVSNLYGMVTGMAEDMQSLVGGTVVRRKVYARFLDAVNFVNGNSDADPEQEVISRWRIEQCSELSAVSASFVLSTPTETDGAVFPGRIMLTNTCTWTYRGDECGYSGPAVADEYDQPTSDITKDKCSKCLSGCKFRNNVGNFGGYLSINKLSQ